MATTGSHTDKNLSKLEAQLELWNTRFAEVMANAKAGGENLKDDAREELDAMKSKLDEVRTRLADAKAAGADKWETLKHGVEETWHDLERTFDKLVH